MYQINIKQGDMPVDIVQDGVCADNVSDVEIMLTQVISKRLGIENLVLMPMGNNTYLVFQVVGPIAHVVIQELKAGG